ncbi:MAG: extensin family protein [Hyphomicrobiales bacterium]|nr:extensin family protein [Alphaproteobacteria bacterium]
MSQRRITLRLLAPLALLAATAGAAQASASELERELYRELHKMPPAAVFPLPETRACYDRLGKIATFTPVPIRVEPSQCARYDMVRLDRVVLPDKSFVVVSPAPSLRCSMAEAVAEWVRDDIVPAAGELGAAVAAISGYDSYECRPRNNIAGGILSEHGKGNALDVGAIKLRNGASFTLTDALVSKPFREAMRSRACARFATVLGPGSDGYHNDHIHIDLAERSNGYKICQWNVLDPAPIAVPLPRSRPLDLAADQSKSR